MKAQQFGVPVSRNGNMATITVAAMKDGEQGMSWDFSLDAPTQVGTTKAGEPIMGCSVTIVREPSFEGTPDEPTQKASKPRGPRSAPTALKAIREAVDKIGAVPPACEYIPARVKTVTEAQWREYAYKMGISTGEERAQQIAFRTASEHLVGAGQVASWNGNFWPVKDDPPERRGRSP